MKTCVSTYSFTQAVNDGKIDYLDIPAKAAEMGFDSIELATAGMPENLNIKDLAVTFREKCDAVDLDIINYTIAADFLGDMGVDEQVKILIDELEIAKVLGAIGLRHDATWGPRPDKGIRTFNDALPILAEGCRAVTIEAEKLGIKTMVENHGYFAQDSDRVEALVTSVKHKNFGLLVDVGNFLCADEKPEIAVGRVASLAHHVHVKDFIYHAGTRPVFGQGWMGTRGGNFLRGTILGHGIVNVEQTLRILWGAGYDGAVSIEFEGVEDCLLALEWGLANLNSFIESI